MNLRAVSWIFLVKEKQGQLICRKKMKGLEREVETKITSSQIGGESNFCDNFPWSLSAPPATGLDETLLLLQYLVR